MDDVGIFYGHLVDFYGNLLYIFVAVWHISRSFGIFFPSWYVAPRKIWQPWPAGIVKGKVNFQQRTEEEDR
jgi:hypothetical protein